MGRLDFLHAPLFATHGAVVEAYLASAKASGRKLVVFSYVGVWTKARASGLKNLRKPLEPVFNARRRAGFLALRKNIITPV